jgi:molybdopterin molybdotransferase
VATDNNMITVETATRLIQQEARLSDPTEVPLASACGRVLREPLVADRDFPPFHRVAMDGIAISSRDFGNGQRIFPVSGIQAAGKPRAVMSGAGLCMEVMTGAVLPEGADAVVRYEDLAMEGGQAEIRLAEVLPWQHVHRQGNDRRQGAVLVREGTLLTPAEIGLAATVGKHRLRVSALPQAVVLSTGEELVAVEETPLPHQIRRSNVHSLAALLAEQGLRVSTGHLPDDPEALREQLGPLLDSNDLLVLSGGVSMGKFDFVPQVLVELGVQPSFHRVSQRPGKPLWFGCRGRTVVFALPGNPVSSFMCTLRYVSPWIRAVQGLPPAPSMLAVLAEDFSFTPGLTYFLQVTVRRDPSGILLASPVVGHGSGDLANLAAADGFLELPKDRQDFHSGESFPLHAYRTPC